MDQWLLAWIILAAAFAIIELATVAFVAIYFALGAAAAAIVAGFGGTVTWQLTALIVTAIVLLVLTRPVLKKRLESPDIPTNVDRLVGRSGVVTIPIDNFENTGQIRVGSEYWTARMPDKLEDQKLAVDTKVKIVSVEGVTARVTAAGSDGQ